MHSLRIPYRSPNLRHRLIAHLLPFTGYGILLLISILFLDGTANLAVYPFIAVSLFSVFFISGPSLLQEYRRQKKSSLVAITAKTIALKPPGEPAIYVPRVRCAHYIPSDHTLLTQDGREFCISQLKFPLAHTEQLLTFLFSHCWPHIERDDYLGIIRDPEMDAWKRIHGDTRRQPFPINLGAALLPIIGGVVLLRLGYTYSAYAVLIPGSAIAFWLASSRQRAHKRDFDQWLVAVRARRVSLFAPRGVD